MIYWDNFDIDTSEFLFICEYYKGENKYAKKITQIVKYFFLNVHLQYIIYIPTMVDKPWLLNLLKSTLLSPDRCTCVPCDYGN